MIKNLAVWLSVFAVGAIIGLASQPASADVFIKNQGGNIDRVDGGYKPMVSVNCGSNMTCSETRVTDTGTFDMLGTGHGSASYTFGTLYSSIDATGSNCATSWAITSTGSALGNFCLPTSNHGVDGGAVLNAEVTLSCFVSTANACKVRACNHQNDGGTVVLGDAGYSCLTFGL